MTRPIAAALSSQLATPLGATATAESIFFLPAAVDADERELKDVEEIEMFEKQETELEIINQWLPPPYLLHLPSHLYQ